MPDRTDLTRLENTLSKVKNPPDVKTSESTEIKSDFKNFMNAPLSSSKKINLNLPTGTVGATTGAVTGGFIGSQINKKDHSAAKEMCTALSTDCVGNPTEPPAMVKKALNNERKTTAKNTIIGAGIGAGIGYGIEKATKGKGLKFGRFNLKIG